MIIKKAMSAELAELVSEGVRELILEAPLVGMALLGDVVNIVGSPCKTAYTDGRVIAVNDGPWGLTLEPLEMAYVLLHEWVHIFCNHVDRGRMMDHKEAWNIACDMTVALHCKDLLGHLGFAEEAIRGGVPPDEKFRDKTEEELYELLLDDDTREKCKGKDGSMEGDLMEAPAEDYEGEIHEALGDTAGTGETLEEFHRRFTDEMRSISKAMEHTGARLPAGLQARLFEILQDTAPWHRILQGKVLQRLGSRYPLYAPINRRSLMLADPVILATQHNMTERHVLLAVDVSGSVHQKLLSAFASNIRPIVARAAKTTMITFDSHVRSEVNIAGPSALKDAFELVSGSHAYTDARGVFEVIDRLKPTATVVLTDGAVQLPAQPYPETFWVIPPNGHVPPWGTTIPLKTQW